MTGACFAAERNPFVLDGFESINDIQGIVDIDASIEEEYSEGLLIRAIEDPEDTKGYPCEGTVNCKYAQNVRNSPWGTIIATYKPGTKVNIVAKTGDWYKISFGGDDYAYLHYSLVDTPTTPAYDGPQPYAYGNSSKSSKQLVSGTSEDSSKSGSSTKITKTVEAQPQNKSILSEDNDVSAAVANSNLSSADINGPEIPDCIYKGIELAKKTKWYTTKDKCLQYAGTIAYKAGAHVSSANSIYPHIAYKPDKTLRGKQIKDLEKAAKDGILLPGMLVHVKAAYDKDPAYNPNTNAHHWFMYCGMENGVPKFADTLKNGSLKTAAEMHRIMLTGNITLSQYKAYGNIRRVSAVYDPFADQR